MKFIMTTTLFATVFLATSAMAGPESGAEERERGKPAAACEKQHQQCMKQCDKEKRLWLFKGEAYESCTAKCEARNQSCLAAGSEKATRGRDMGRRGDAADRREEMREDAAERSEEMREDADERREEMQEDADERREEMREGAEERRGEARATAEERRNAAEQQRGRGDDEDDSEDEDDTETEEAEEDDDGNDRGKARGKGKGNDR